MPGPPQTTDAAPHRNGRPAPDSPAFAVLLAALLFAAIFVLRLAIDETDAAVLFLFCLPIAVLAIRFGVAGGLAAAALATALVVAWATSDTGVELGVVGYGSRVATFFLLGALVGLFSQRSAAGLEAARRATRETTAILASTTDAVYRLDRDGRCVFANPATLDVLGWAAEDLQGEDAHALLHHSRGDGTPYPHDECPVFATLGDGVPRGGADEAGHEIFWHKAGRPVVVDYRVSPVVENSTINGVVVSVRDVTEQTHDRDRLRRYADQLSVAETATALASASPARTSPAEPSSDPPPGPAPDDPIAQALELVRDRLGLDIAFVGRFVDGQETFPVVAGPDGSFSMEPIPLDGSYCVRMVGGPLPNLVADARGDERVRDLAVTADLDIGAYLGVPITLADGRVYGALCAISHDVEHGLDDSDVRFMEVLSALVARELERREVEEELHRVAAERAIATAQTSHVRALIAALETRDEYTGSHSESVVALAGEVARRLGLSADALAAVEHTALLHDIGKVGVPDAILRKPGALDDLEWTIMRQHPAIGARLVEGIEPLAHLAPAIRAEHERWDGAGYPDGLAGEDIPIAARIGFACDAYHAMTSHRPYRRAMPHQDALAELRRNSGSQFDPQVIDALLGVLRTRAMTDPRADREDAARCG